MPAEAIPPPPGLLERLVIMSRCVIACQPSFTLALLITPICMAVSMAFWISGVAPSTLRCDTEKFSSFRPFLASMGPNTSPMVEPISALWPLTTL